MCVRVNARACLVFASMRACVRECVYVVRECVYLCVNARVCYVPECACVFVHVNGRARV